MNTNDSIKTCPKCGLTVPAQAPEGLCPKCVLAAAASTEPAPTATAQIPSLDRVAAAFPQLEILELIGRGGMGFVFKARQPTLDRLVALKLLPDSLAQDPQFAERFNREGRTLARLNHPNIVSIFDFGYAPGAPISQSACSSDSPARAGSETGVPPQPPDAVPNSPTGFYYLLMEYVDGVNLRQAMQAGRFSPAEALTIIPKICEALQYAHEEGILHRDIKPENILLDAKGRVKIADFGIAKLIGEDRPDLSLTATGATLGTPHYMAPEQFEKPASVDHRADIYSLGVVFYEMLTGELPLGRFAAPSAKAPLDERIDEIVFRALEKEREKRFQSAGEVKTNVEHVTEAGAGGLKAPPPKFAGTPPSPAKTKLVSPEDVIPTTPRWSQKAIWGAAITGISVPFPLFCVAAIYFHLGALGGLEVVLLLGSISIPGLAGTILGWMGVSDLRTARGRLRGLPLALFAALTWPLGMLLLITFVAPLWYYFVSIPAHYGAVKPISAGLMLVVPAGSLTFAIWAIYATVRWARNEPTPERRGKLKWIFLGVMASGLGFIALSHFSQLQKNRAQPPVVAVQAATARVDLVSVARHPSDGNWWKPDGTLLPDKDLGIVGNTSTNPADHVYQFAFAGSDDSINPARTFRFDGGYWSSHPFPERVGWPLSNGTYVVCRFPVQRQQTDIRVGEASGPPQQTFRVNIRGQKTFTTRLSHENGVATFSGRLTNHLGVTLLALTNDLLNHDIRVVAMDRDGHEHLGRNTASATWDDDDFTFANLTVEEISGLRLELRRYRWMHIRNVALQPRPARGPAGIRFTITAVELLEKEDRNWLAFDYQDQVFGDCAKAFPWDSTTTGFKGVTRTSEFLGGDKSAPVRHQRVEYQLSGGLTRDELRRLREEVAGRWLQKTFWLKPGEQRLLFEVPTPDGGALQGRIKVVPSSPPPARAAANSALEFRLISEDGDTVTPADELPERHRDGNETKRRVLRTVMLDGSSVARADIDPEPTGTPAISVRLNAEGARQFAAITAANIGRALAIVANGRIVSAPIIRTAISGGELKISGSFSDEEARQLVATLNHQPAGLEYGPVTEQFMAEGTAMELFSKRVITVPPSLARASQSPGIDVAIGDWIKRQDMDIAYLGRGRFYNSGQDMNAMTTEEWDDLSPAQLEASLHPNGKEVVGRFDGGEPLAFTYGFRTRAGRLGLLQIKGYRENEAGVTIRYKLVRPGTNITNHTEAARTSSKNSEIGWLRGTWIYDKDYSARKTAEMRTTSRAPQKTLQEVISGVPNSLETNKGLPDPAQLAANMTSLTANMLSGMRDSVELQLMLDLLTDTQITFDSTEVSIISRLTPPNTMAYDEIKMVNPDTLRVRYGATNGSVFCREGERFRLDFGAPNPFVAFYFRRLQSTNGQPPKIP